MGIKQDKVISDVKKHFLEGYPDIIITINTIDETFIAKGLFAVDKNDELDDELAIVFWEMLTGNCGICLFYDLNLDDFEEFLTEDYVVSIMDDIASAENYSLMMYTTSDKQSSLEKALKYNDWDRVSSTYNKNSGNKISIWTKEI